MRTAVTKKTTRGTWAKEWDKLASELPDVEMTDKDIMKEIKAHRNGRRK